MTSDLVRRATATERTMARYRDRPFSWRSRATCLHMARFHLRAMGYRPPPIPDIRSAIGAQRALKRHGHESVTALLDSMLERIPPAAMLVGDLAAVPGDHGLDAILLCAGDKLIGWREDAEYPVPIADALPHVTAAWRV